MVTWLPGTTACNVLTEELSSANNKIVFLWYITWLGPTWHQIKFDFAPIKLKVESDGLRVGTNEAILARILATVLQLPRSVELVWPATGNKLVLFFKPNLIL